MTDTIEILLLTLNTVYFLLQNFVGNNKELSVHKTIITTVFKRVERMIQDIFMKGSFLDVKKKMDLLMTHNTKTHSK